MKKKRKEKKQHENCLGMIQNTGIRSICTVYRNRVLNCMANHSETQFYVVLNSPLIHFREFVLHKAHCIAASNVNNIKFPRMNEHEFICLKLFTVSLFSLPFYQTGWKYSTCDAFCSEIGDPFVSTPCMIFIQSRKSTQFESLSPSLFLFPSRLVLCINSEHSKAADLMHSQY